MNKVKVHYSINDNDDTVAAHATHYSNINPSNEVYVLSRD